MDALFQNLPEHALNRLGGPAGHLAATGDPEADRLRLLMQAELAKAQIEHRRRFSPTETASPP